MGISIHERVISSLREAGFPADAAYPGQKYPVITGPVAAVHLEKVDQTDLTVTVAVSILCPAALGGAQCELEALRAAELLRGIGASCIQNGCQYDGLAQVYVVKILADFLCDAEAQDCTMGPGFQIFLEETSLPFVISFQSDQVPKSKDDATWIWEIQLEELIPAGSPETAEPEDTFQLRLEREGKAEIYSDCRWTSVRREFTRQGLRRIHTGISALRQEDTGE